MLSVSVYNLLCFLSHLRMCLLHLDLHLQKFNHLLSVPFLHFDGFFQRLRSVDQELYFPVEKALCLFSCPRNVITRPHIYQHFTAIFQFCGYIHTSCHWDQHLSSCIVSSDISHSRLRRAKFGLRKLQLLKLLNEYTALL